MNIKSYLLGLVFTFYKGSQPSEQPSEQKYLFIKLKLIPSVFENWIPGKWQENAEAEVPTDLNQYF